MAVSQERVHHITLRPATADDEAFLRQVYDSTRKDELEILGWDAHQTQAFLDLQFRAQTENYRMSYAKADSQIILLNASPVGRILIDRREHEIALIDIALLAQFRGLGIGTHLIQQLLDEAGAAAKSVRLHVLKLNPAFRLYERLGFSRTADDGVYFEMKRLPKSC